MTWLERFRRSADEASSRGGVEPGARAVEQRPSPGVAALFDLVRRDREQVILDLGHASEAHLRLFRVFADRARFAGWLPSPPRGREWRAALADLPPGTGAGYDIVLAWDILDLLEDGERGALVERLAELTAPGGLVYLLLRGRRGPGRRHVRHTLRDIKTVSEETLGPVHAGGGELLPAHLERLMAPGFEVLRGFTLRGGLREYIARRAEAPAA